MEFKLREVLTDLETNENFRKIYNYEYQQAKNMEINDMESDEDRECLLSHYRKLVKKYEIKHLKLMIKLVKLN